MINIELNGYIINLSYLVYMSPYDDSTQRFEMYMANNAQIIVYLNSITTKDLSEDRLQRIKKLMKEAHSSIKYSEKTFNKTFLSHEYQQLFNKYTKLEINKNAW